MPEVLRGVITAVVEVASFFDRVDQTKNFQF